MNDLETTLQNTRVRWLRWLSVGAGVLLLAASAPIIWLAVSGGIGLLALGAILAAGFAAVQALPWAGQMLENRLLQVRKGEARRNPIEQMQNQLMFRAQQLETLRAALTGIYAQIEGMSEMLRERRRATPDHDLSRQQAALQKMTAFYTAHVKKLGAAEVALADYKKHLEMKVFEWNFAQHGRAVLQKLKATDQESILRDMLADEASQSVQSHFNQVFAELDMEVRTMGQADVLDFGAGMQVDLRALRTPIHSTASQGV